MTEELMKYFNITIQSNENEFKKDQIDKSMKNNKLSSAWDREATLLLISLYKENEHKFKNTTIRNEQVWHKISEILKSNGHIFSKVQCEHKFKYLKQRYIKKKDNMSSNKQSGAEPFTFDYFNEFDDIFSKKPNVTPIAVASSSRGCSMLESGLKWDDILESNDTEGNTFKKGDKIEKMPPTKKSRLCKEITNWTDIFKSQNDAKEESKERRHKERQDLTKRAVDVYETMMQKLIDKL